MNFKNLISATVLMVGFGIAPHVHAHFVETPVETDAFNVLSTHDWKNDELQNGTYDFVQIHSKVGKTFNDTWGFSLAQDTLASISIFDLELGTSGAGALTQWQNHHQSHGKKNDSWLNSGKLLDNKFLSFSLFDEDGNLLGSAGENGSLNNLALHAGEWYTLSVSAKINGLFGSAYHGTLTTAPAAVPLGDSLPFFASGLGLLALRYRKRLQPKRSK